MAKNSAVTGEQSVGSLFTDFSVQSAYQIMHEIEILMLDHKHTLESAIEFATGNAAEQIREAGAPGFAAEFEKMFRNEWRENLDYMAENLEETRKRRAAFEKRKHKKRE